MLQFSYMWGIKAWEETHRTHGGEMESRIGGLPREHQFCWPHFISQKENIWKQNWQNMNSCKTGWWAHECRWYSLYIFTIIFSRDSGIYGWNLGGGTALSFQIHGNKGPHLTPGAHPICLCTAFTPGLPMGSSNHNSMLPECCDLIGNWNKLRTPYRHALLQHPEFDNTHISFWSSAFDPGTLPAPSPLSLWALLHLALIDSSWKWPKSDVVSSVKPMWSKSQVHPEWFPHSQ